ncbi:MAG: ABC transporter ATP-binding protein/permease [Ruminococcus sp.]|nr:ABC transporter ATP-binding protein/permease [Ruminococcus sp.]MCD7799901.1 ABC transporter ATP-binding protein/permease [Ruminococcus sp.]
MKKLLIHLKGYLKECIIAPLFKLLEALFELFIPIVMASVIDVGIANGDRLHIYKMCGLMALLGLIGLVCSLIAQYFSAKASVGFAVRLRSALMEHIQKFSFTEADTVGTSTLITRMTSDINQLQTGVNMVLRLFLRSPFIVFGAMIASFTIDVKSASVFCVTIPLLSVVVFGVMYATVPLYKKVQSSLDRITLSTRENLSGARVIRAFSNEESEVKNFIEDNSTLKKAQLHASRISAIMNPVTYSIVNISAVVLIYVGAFRVDAGVLTQGEVVALINYMSQILVELVKLANLIVTITKAVACGNRVQSVFEIDSSMQNGSKIVDTLNHCETIVSFKDVSFKYAGAGANSLTNISFNVKKGETIGIIGSTGSGKSTLVNLIPRFYDASSGSICIDGLDVKDYSLESLRSKISVVMQKTSLFKGTIYSNMLVGNQNATSEDIQWALDVSQSAEFVASKSEGINTVVSQNGKNFSGGQRQRLTIARALVKRPEILILDDSSSALDYATDLKLRTELKSIPNMTVFIVSQRTSSIQSADKIIVLDDGQMVGIGSHDELVQNCDVYKEIYNSQFQKKG